MKKLLGILVLGFFLITPSQADDIRNFQIEGMGIGDSLLDYFTKSEIKNNTKNYYDKKPNFKYVAIDIENNKSFEEYFGIQVHVKKNDDQFIIHGISGYNYYRNNIENCYAQMKVVEKDLEKFFKNLKKEKHTFDHPLDPTGESKVTAIYFKFSNGDNVAINCYNWTDEIDFADNFDVSLDTKEFFSAASKL